MSDRMSKIAMLEALENGKGIQYLLNEGCEILENPILAHDMSYKIISFTENVETDDPIWMEYVTTGTVSSNWLTFFKEEDFLDVAANTKTVAYLLSEKLKYKRIYGKLFNKENIQIGCACITEAHKPFEEDALTLFECFCSVLDKEIALNEFYSQYGQAYQETLINDLIANSVDNKKTYTAHVESIYKNLRKNIYLAVVDANQDDYPDNHLAYFRDQLIGLFPDFKYSIYENYIVILLSADKKITDIKKNLPALDDYFKQNNMRVGLSDRFDNMFDLHKHFSRAVNMLNSDR